METLTTITLAWDLFSKGMPKSHIAEYLCKNRETIHIWIKGIQQYGLKGYLNRYELAKKGSRASRQLDPIIKSWIFEIRQRERDCCGQKILYYLQQEHNVSVSVPKIYEVLKERYKIKSKWTRDPHRGHVPKASNPREVVQMDSVVFGDIYAFTGIDICSREVDVILAPKLNSQWGQYFLKQSMKRRFDNFVDTIQTDGGPEFKDSFSDIVMSFCNTRRIARPYKKNEQSFIESFNRTLRKECLGWSNYNLYELPACKKRVESFLYKYHYIRPHISLGMKPPLKLN